MAQNSGIEWTDHTANLWWGCTAVHAGCDNCYAEALAKRYASDVWGNERPRRAIKSVWGDFMKYQALAHKAGQVHKVFVGSMMDIFEKPMLCVTSQGEVVEGGTESLRQRFFSDIVPNCPNLMFLLLTKRPSNINKMIPARWLIDPPANVMFGTSPVDQKTFDTLVPQLLRVNGRRFLSIEPQLDSIELHNTDGIHWVIQGGESGPKRRPFSTWWGRQVRDYCAQAEIPYFFKQIDKVQTIPGDLLIQEFPT